MIDKHTISNQTERNRKKEKKRKMRIRIQTTVCGYILGKNKRIEVPASEREID